MLTQSLHAARRIGSAVVSEPGKAADAARGAVRIGALLLSSPGQWRNLPRWVPTIRRTPVDLRVPWLPFDVIDVLDRFLGGAGRVLEFGGGGSTLWFAAHSESVVTVEHDEEWLDVLRSMAAPLENVTVLGRTDPDFDAYVNAADEFPDDHFDVVVVDGKSRVRAFERSMSKVRPGGLLVLDDSERPEYRPAIAKAAHWPSTTLRGLTPTKNMAGQTTIWTRPALLTEPA